jgi:GNAT superfamily N-acetyltransferase
MSKKITIKKATIQDFKKLSKLDYTYIYDKMFEIRQTSNKISLREVKLKKPITNNSTGYQKEIIEFIEKLKEKNSLALVAFCDSKPVGYLLSSIKKWPNGVVVEAGNILISKEYRQYGIATALFNDIILRAKKIKNCRGIHVEMCTEKYAANKLLLKMNFKFSGTTLHVYSSKEPHKYSKEALYFYYKI